MPSLGRGADGRNLTARCVSALRCVDRMRGRPPDSALDLTRFSGRVFAIRLCRFAGELSPFEVDW